MNRFEKFSPDTGAAKLHYGDGEFVVLSPGTYVVCAVTGQRIPLDTLRYWSVLLQEAYASADIATERHNSLQTPGRS